MKLQSRVRQMFRSPASPLIAQGDKARDARRWEDAAKAYAEALAMDPRLMPIWVQYGHALKEAGDLAGAEKAYRRAIAGRHDVADTHLQLGHLLKIGGRPTEAADAYITALELDITLSDALREIQDLTLRGAIVPADRLSAVMDRITGAAPPEPRAMLDADNPENLAAAIERLRAAGLATDDLAVLGDAAARLRRMATQMHTTQTHDIALVFDASDLVHHFRHSRILTGVQRVQLEIIRSLALAEPSAQICAAFNEHWVRIPTSLFLQLANLATSGGDKHAPDWRMATTRLQLALNPAQIYQFPRGGCLVNLGTSWQVDYLLRIRSAKRDYGIRFVPFVHDLIPIIAPQYVVSDLTKDYVAWLLSVFDHADFFLTNSRSTRTDLVTAAAQLGYVLAEDDVLVVQLNARFSSTATSPEARRDFLREKGLYRQPFVLLVSTIEPRKNHLAAINAWATLLGEFGSRMPKLICVGGHGWMNDDVFRLVSSDDLLGRHVIFLHGLSDVELAACYDACLFTLFPSHYEGWGLPVTESLCHGKVPLLSDNSSLPEAGGPFGVYFQSGSQPTLVAALRKLIGDPDHRGELERRIAAEFRPRGWDALADQIRAALAERFGAGSAAPRSGIADIRLGSFYAFWRNAARRVRPDLVSGYALRAGTEWHSPEDWGSWARGVTVAIEGRLPAGTIRAFIGVRGMPGVTATLIVSVDDHEVIEAQIPGSETRWLPLTFQPSERPVRIEVRSDQVINLASLTTGEDGRTVGPGLLGFYACSADDVGARLAFIEALASGVLIPGALSHSPGTHATSEEQVAHHLAAGMTPETLDGLGQETAPVSSIRHGNADRTDLDHLPGDILPLASSGAEDVGPAGVLSSASRLLGDSTEEGAESWIAKGRLYADLGDARSAEEAYRQALALDPDNAWTSFRLGLVAISSGKPLAGLENFQRAYLLDPTSEELRINLANTLLTLRRWKAAKIVAESLGGDLPDWWASTRHDIFSAYHAARARLRALLETRRENGGELDLESSIEAATLLSQLGKLRVARNVCCVVIRKQPDNIEAHLLLSRIIAELEGIGSSIDFLTSVNDLFNDQSHYEILLAQLYYEWGDIEMALAHGVKSGMKDPATLYARGQYLAAGGKWTKLFDLASEWMETTEDTRPYAMMLGAGRGLDRWHVPGERSEATSSFRSRTIIQFWDQESIPADVMEAVKTWSAHNPGYAHKIFSDPAAFSYIEQFFGREAADIFRHCHHPAMKSDFFRVCYLYNDGGIYVDADEICIRPLDNLINGFGNAEFAAWVSSDVFPYAYNGFLAAAPRNEILRLALDDMIALLANAKLAGIKPDIWHTTGPGVFTRALARGVKTGVVNKENTMLLTTAQYRSVAHTDETLQYKLSRSGNWRLN